MSFRLLTIFLLQATLVLVVNAQNLTTNLPIIVITPDGQITDEPKVGAHMKIIYNGDGQLNHYSDINNPQSLNYDGRIAIETRGSSSQAPSKKAYGFETRENDNVTNKNVSLLNMPSENDWILNGLAFDPSLLHDYLAYNLHRSLGHYSARTVFCEVFIDSDYRGVYLLQEKIKVDGDRVDILDLSVADNALPAMSGGYIIKADKTTGGDPVAFVMDGNHLNGYHETIDFIYDTPEPQVISNPQKAYIESVFRDLESKAAANNASVTNGFPSIIDIPTFIDYMLVSEIGSSVDAYKYSTYFHKDRNGKLRAGPVWDFNYGFGLVGGQPDGRSGTSGWQFENGNNEGPKFFRQIFYNSDYKCYLSRRWNQLTQPNSPLNIDLIDATIDAMKLKLTAAAGREESRWHTIGNFDNQISFLKQFIRDRSTWMTNNIGSFGACTNPPIPELVINEIMYNAPSGANGPSNDQEFIEIKNNGNQNVNLSGLYFAGLGMEYQFPANSTIGSGQLLVIASNAANFAAKYGSQPFGQFTRNLSNKSQKLVLSDAFGNVIDLVAYTDSAPWPPEADGTGKSLELKSPNLDNSIGSNWAVGYAINGSPGMDNAGSLPVRIISFKGTLDNSIVNLSWTVSEEVNVDKYLVEWSIDGKSFSYLDEIKAVQEPTYEFNHSTQVTGITYYRLKAVDYDGSITYSRIISIKRIDENDLILYPNPSNGKFSVQLKPEIMNRELSVKIIADNAREVRSFKTMSEGSVLQFDISDLRPGLYSVVIDSGAAIVTRKLFIGK